MAARIQFPPLLLFFVLSSSFLPRSSSQFAPQNIQVYYPFPLPPPPLPPPPPPPRLPPPPPPSTDTDTPTPTPTPTPVTNNPPSNSSNKTVAKAVAATAASTLVLSGLLFLLFVKYRRHQKEKQKPIVQGSNETGNTQDPVLMLNSRFTRVEAIKGVIVDEEGLDVLYWKNLDNDDDDDGGNNRPIFKKEHPTRVDHGGRKSEKFDVHIQEVPLLRGKSSGSHVWPSGEEIKSQNDSLPVVAQEVFMKTQKSSRSPPPTPASPPLPPPPPVVIESKSCLPPPPPPPLPPETSGLTSSSKLPQPPPVQLKPLVPNVGGIDHWNTVMNAEIGQMWK